MTGVQRLKRAHSSDHEHMRFQLKHVEKGSLTLKGLKDPTRSVKVWFGSCRAPCGTCRVRSPSSSVVGSNDSLGFY